MPSSGPLTAIHSISAELHVSHVGAGKSRRCREGAGLGDAGGERRQRPWAYETWDAHPKGYVGSPQPARNVWTGDAAVCKMQWGKKVEKRSPGLTREMQREACGNAAYVGTVKMPGVGRQLFYLTFYRCKFPFLFLFFPPFSRPLQRSTGAHPRWLSAAVRHGMSRF